MGGLSVHLGHPRPQNSKSGGKFEVRVAQFWQSAGNHSRKEATGSAAAVRRGARSLCNAQKLQSTRGLPPFPPLVNEPS